MIGLTKRGVLSCVVVPIQVVPQSRPRRHRASRSPRARLSPPSLSPVVAVDHQRAAPCHRAPPRRHLARRRRAPVVVSHPAPPRASATHARRPPACVRPPPPSRAARRPLRRHASAPRRLRRRPSSHASSPSAARCVTRPALPPSPQAPPRRCSPTFFFYHESEGEISSPIAPLQ